MRMVLALLAAACIAGPASAAGGGSPFSFLSLDAGARPAALGGAYAAAGADPRGGGADANALHYNPAGLARVERHEATFMHNEHFQGASQDYAALALRQGIGFEVSTVGYGRVQRTTLSSPSGAGLGSFGARDLAAGLGYGRAVAQGLSLGLGLKYIRSELDGHSASAVAGDIGALCSPERAPKLSLALAAQNLGGRARFQSAQEELPSSLKLGAAYALSLGRAGGLATLDISKERRGDWRVGAGIEARPVESIALRLGYDGRIGADPRGGGADSGVTAGFGAGAGALWLDYAFVPFGALGNAHRLAVTLRWGPARDEVAQATSNPWREPLTAHGRAWRLDSAAWGPR